MDELTQEEMVEILDHANLIVVALLTSGVGFNCPDTYRGLLELAHFLQSEGGFDDYEPQGLIAEFRASHEEEEFLVVENITEAEDVDPGEIIH